MWSGAWVNARGERVELWLVYRYPRSAGPNDNPSLQVIGFYMSAETVERVRAQVDQLQKRLDVR